MRLLVVDDEPAARAKLRRLLAAHADVDVVLEAADAPSAITLLAREGPVDLAVLDVEMPGANGLQLAAELSARNPAMRCVFSTAYSEHALRAFELGAVDYLLKPFHAERLAATMDRVREWLAKVPPTSALRADPGTWWVGTREGRQRIDVADVQWVASADNYVALHLPPQSYLERGTLSAWLAQPLWASLLVRVHRCHAVNPQHVMAVSPQPGGEALLTLRSGMQLGVSRRFRAALNDLSPQAGHRSPQTNGAVMGDQ